MLISRMEKLPKDYMRFPHIYVKYSSFWYWYFILDFMKLIENWQNRTARVEKQRKTLPVCINVLFASVPEALIFG